MEKEATIEEKIRIRKKEKAKKRGTANRRMEHGQPMQKKRRIEAGLKANDSIPEEEGRGREDLRHEEGGEEDCGRQKDEETRKHRLNSKSWSLLIGYEQALESLIFYRLHNGGPGNDLHLSFL